MLELYCDKCGKTHDSEKDDFTFVRIMKWNNRHITYKELDICKKCINRIFFKDGGKIE